MSRWRLETIDQGQIEVYVDSPQFGDTFVGTLWLSDEDLAELAKALDAVRP